MSKACSSGLSSEAFPSAALIPPSAAPEWLRVGWSFETSATSAPASNASIAARMPAQPAPIDEYVVGSPPSGADAIGSPAAARRRAPTPAEATIARTWTSTPALPRLGSTARRDAWWVAPARDGRRPRRASASTRSSRRSRARTTATRRAARLPLAVLLARPREPVRARPAVLARAPRPLGAARASRSPVTTTARRTTARSSWLPARLRRRRPRRRRYRGESRVPVRPPERAPLLPLLRDRRRSASSGTTPVRAFFFETATARSSSASASARSCCS